MDLLGLFRRAEPADGAAPGLEAAALNLNPGLPDASVGIATAVAGPGRRERQADAGSDLVAEALGAKLLHGWLQNRHQTLMPLSLNLSLIPAEGRRALARILASVLLAGRPSAQAAEAAPGLRDWLAGLGADGNTLAGFDEALDAPLPLNVLFETAQAHDLTVYAYVATLVASDPDYPVSTMLCDMIQTRFDLPSALVRSATRRYRR